MKTLIDLISSFCEFFIVITFGFVILVLLAAFVMWDSSIITIMFTNLIFWRVVIVACLLAWLVLVLPSVINKH